MGHEELKEIGINAYGHRHKLIKGVERLLGGQQGKLLKNKEVSEISDKVSCEVKVTHFMSNSLQPHGLCSPWNSLGQNTGVGS